MKMTAEFCYIFAFHRFRPSRKKLYFVKKPFKKTPAPEMRQDFFDLPLMFQVTEKLSAWSTWVLLWNFYKLLTEIGLPDSRRRHMRSELALFCRVKMSLWPSLALCKQNTEGLDVIKTLQIRKLTCTHVNCSAISSSRERSLHWFSTSTGTTRLFQRQVAV